MKKMFPLELHKRHRLGLALAKAGLPFLGGSACAGGGAARAVPQRPGQRGPSIPAKGPRWGQSSPAAAAPSAPACSLPSIADALPALQSPQLLAPQPSRRVTHMHHSHSPRSPSCGIFLRGAGAPFSLCFGGRMELPAGMCHTLGGDAAHLSTPCSGNSQGLRGGGPGPG